MIDLEKLEKMATPRSEEAIKKAEERKRLRQEREEKAYKALMEIGSSDYQIDMSKCPKQEKIDIYKPDGTLLISTDYEYEFDWIRKQIAENVLDGYYVIVRGKKHMINHYGVVHPYPDGLFDISMSMAGDIIRAGIATKRKEEELGLIDYKGESMIAIIKKARDCVSKFVAERCELDGITINLTAKLFDDLSFDELDMIDLYMILEKEFNHNIPELPNEREATVGDLCKHINHSLKENIYDDEDD